jgi:cobalt-zinc-cadmium efflux system protein
MLQETINILMEGVPADLDLDEVVRQMQDVEGVRSTHHLHAWQIDEHHTALEAHIVIDKGDLEHMERIKNLVKGRLHDHFGIHHSTLEFEYESCRDTLREHCFVQVVG